MCRDYCFPNPGTIKKLACSVCGEPMKVTRTQVGPTTFAEAMGGFRRRHDLFECLHRKDDWHRQAHQLKETARKTPSKRFGDLLLDEAQSIIQSSAATKEWSAF